MHAKWDDSVDTNVPLKTIEKLSQQLVTLPEGFTLHPVVAKLYLNDKK